MIKITIGYAIIYWNIMSLYWRRNMNKCKMIGIIIGMTGILTMNSVQALGEVRMDKIDTLETSVFIKQDEKEFHEMIRRIIELKESGFSVDEVIVLMDRENGKAVEEFKVPVFKSFSLTDKIQTGYEQWSRLTSREKWLIVTSPFKAIETFEISKKAFGYTEKEFGYNGLGDRSDAFRHATWNALLCKYIDKEWAEDITTAHEEKSEEELNRTASDGNTERQHRNMDLHNNEQGRLCWYYSDSEDSTSDETLINRVINKLNGGELIILNQ